MTERKKILLRLDPVVHDAIARWAGDELRSTNAQIEFLLRNALAAAGRLPSGVGRLPRRGRPPKRRPGAEADADAGPSTGTSGVDENAGGSDGPGGENATDADDGTEDGGEDATADVARPPGPT